MTFNLIGYVGAVLFVGGLIGFGMLIENFRASIALRRRSKYKFRFKPKPVPNQPKEWGVVTPSEMFESVCRKIVQESPEKFK